MASAAGVGHQKVRLHELECKGHIWSSVNLLLVYLDTLEVLPFHHVLQCLNLAISPYLLFIIFFKVATALETGHIMMSDKQHDTNDALEMLTAGLVKAGLDAKEALVELTTQLGSGQTKVVTSVDTARDSLDHIMEAIETHGQKLETGLGSVRDKAAFLEALSQNLKLMDTNSKGALERLAIVLQENSQNLVTSVDSLGDEVREVGGKVETGQEKIAANIEGGHTKVSVAITETDKTLNKIGETLHEQKESVEDGLNQLATKLFNSGTERNKMLQLLIDYLKINAENIKNLDTASQQSLTTLAQNIASAAQASVSSLETIGSKIGEASMNIAANGEGLENIADNIEGNNGELNFIIKNMTSDIANGLLAVETQLKTTGTSLLGSLDGSTDKMTTSLAELENIKNSITAGLTLLSTNTESAGEGAKAGLEAVAANILSSVFALETELVSSLDTGNTKVATAIDGTRTSLNTIKDSVELQRDKLDSGLHLLATTLAKSGNDGKAGKSKYKKFHPIYVHNCNHGTIRVA